MANEFQKVSKSRLSDLIILQVKEMIYSGTLKPGDHLPSERELATQLSVSRLPLREALKALEATHVLESRAGDGYYVCGLETDSFVQLLHDSDCSDHTFLSDLKEARLVIEGAAVKLACSRRTDTDISLLKQTVAEMEDAFSHTQRTDVISTSLQFHRYVVAASHNQLLSAMLDCMASALQTGRSQTTDSRYGKALEEHSALLDAIIAQDETLAEVILTEHLKTPY